MRIATSVHTDLGARGPRPSAILIDQRIRLVDAHAVLVDGEPLRGADHRRGREAAVVRCSATSSIGISSPERDQPAHARSQQSGP